MDEKVPLAAEDFSNIVIQHLLDKAALVNLTMVLSSQKGSKVGQRSLKNMATSATDS